MKPPLNSPASVSIRIDATTDQALRDAVCGAIEAVLSQGSLHHQAAERPNTTTAGVALQPGQRLRAADLRQAILLGKVPEDAGLLVDSDMIASLLSVSKRTVSRLSAEGAIPKAVRLGTLVRWRLTEILEWVDEGCQAHWSQLPSGKKKTR